MCFVLRLQQFYSLTSRKIQNQKRPPQFERESKIEENKTTNTSTQNSSILYLKGCIVYIFVNNKENIFINVLNLKYQTIVRLTLGSIEGIIQYQLPQRRRVVAHLIIDRIFNIIGGHYDYIKLIIKTSPNIEHILYIKEALKRH